MCSCCLLLAFKFNCTARPSVVKQRLRPFFKAIEEKWRISQRDTLQSEMKVFAELSFDLAVPVIIINDYVARIKARHPHLAS